MSSARLRTLLDVFITNVEKVIPELKETCSKVRDEIKSDFAGFVRKTVSLLGENDEKIVSRDDSVIETEVLPGLRITPYWKELSSTSKDAVWKFLNLILLAGAKYVRSHSTKSSDPIETSNPRNEDESLEEMATEVAKRLADPALREKMIEEIHKTFKDVETRLDDEDDDDGPDLISGITALLKGFTAPSEGVVEDTTEKTKMMESFLEGVRETKIGKIVEGIVSDISGDLRAESLGIDVETFNPADIMKLIGNPTILKKLLGIAGKASESMNSKMKSGEITQEELALEGEALLSKSQDMLKAINPQAAALLQTLQKKTGKGGAGGKVGTRDLMRKMEKMDPGKMMSVIQGGRGGGVKERLQRKLEEKKRGQDATSSAPASPATSSTIPVVKKKSTKKNP